MLGKPSLAGPPPARTEVGPYTINFVGHLPREGFNHVVSHRLPRGADYEQGQADGRVNEEPQVSNDIPRKEPRDDVPGYLGPLA
jgi:hypothetical protein